MARGIKQAVQVTYRGRQRWPSALVAGATKAEDESLLLGGEGGGRAGKHKESKRGQWPAKDVDAGAKFVSKVAGAGLGESKEMEVATIPTGGVLLAAFGPSGEGGGRGVENHGPAVKLEPR